MSVTSVSDHRKGSVDSALSSHSYCKSGYICEDFFSGIALKDIFATLKLATRAWFIPKLAYFYCEFAFRAHFHCLPSKH